MSTAKIEVEESNLEDLIILGEDKLIDCYIEYPTENGTINAKAKIKQLTMKEIKNMNLDPKKVTFETNIDILKKALFKQDGTTFNKELILELPVGVVNALSDKILEVSGVDTDIKKY